MAASSSSTCEFLIFFFILFLSAASASPWDKLVNLTGCRAGDTHLVIPDLKKYLHQFGYLPNIYDDDDQNQQVITDYFDDDLLSAVQRYQLYSNLDVTGVLDPLTVDLLMTPRCGVPDIINGSTTGGGGLLRYAHYPGDPKWNKLQLTYAFMATGGVKIDDPTLQITDAIRSAFDHWEVWTKFTFSEVSPQGNPDIEIGFYSRKHGDGFPFDGQGGTLAHAYRPTDGRVHFDLDEDWFMVQPQSRVAVHLESVATHEIGHLLGLEHSTLTTAIMYRALPPQTVKVIFDQDDIDGIRTLYGWTPIMELHQHRRTPY